jgi:hypothetical protein
LQTTRVSKYGARKNSCGHVLKPETTGTKPPERPEQESEMTGTTKTKHDRNNVVDHDRNDSYVGLTIVPIVFDFGSGGSGHF